ncbi:MAG: putative inorganic carbon transporter subunit DabA [Dokdonella sp.]
MIWTWQHSPVAEQSEAHTVHGSAWRLFRLAQHLGISGGELRTLSLADLEALLEPLDELPSAVRGALWQCAYEHHYRAALINALANNHQRRRERAQRPQAQIIFCIDDREESIRRHIEELNPRIETLGAAGFFGVVMNWRGLDDRDVTPLCPVVVTPAHEVREAARTGTELQLALHNRRRDLRSRLMAGYHEVRRNLLSSALLINALAPAALLTLIGKVFFPVEQAHFVAAVDAAACSRRHREPTRNTSRLRFRRPCNRACAWESVSRWPTMPRCLVAVRGRCDPVRCRTTPCTASLRMPMADRFHRWDLPSRSCTAFSCSHKTRMG